LTNSLFDCNKFGENAFLNILWRKIEITDL